MVNFIFNHSCNYILQPSLKICKQNILQPITTTNTIFIQSNIHIKQPLIDKHKNKPTIYSAKRPLRSVQETLSRIYSGLVLALPNLFSNHPLRSVQETLSRIYSGLVLAPLNLFFRFRLCINIKSYSRQQNHSFDSLLPIDPHSHNRHTVVKYTHYKSTNNSPNNCTNST